MPFDPERHHRHTIRLRGFDYSQAGAYFITICTHERRCLFGDVVEGLFHPSSFGKIAEEVWCEIPCHFPAIDLDAFVVMPNHVHGILCIDGPEGTACRAPTEGEEMPTRFGHPAAGSLPTVIGAYKSAVARRVNGQRCTPGGNVWQRDYYERIIRSEKMLGALREYIVHNPANWHQDIDYSDW